MVEVAEAGFEGERLTLSIHARLRRAGLGTKMIIDGARSDEPDVSLIKLLINAHELRDGLLNGDGISIAELSKRESLTGSYVSLHGVDQPGALGVVRRDKQPVDRPTSRS